MHRDFKQEEFFMVFYLFILVLNIINFRLYY